MATLPRLELRAFLARIPDEFDTGNLGRVLLMLDSARSQTRDLMGLDNGSKLSYMAKVNGRPKARVNWKLTGAYHKVARRRVERDGAAQARGSVPGEPGHAAVNRK